MSRPSSGPDTRVTIKEHDFLAMMRRLALQSEGRREAGAFIMGSTADSDGDKAGSVTAVLYYCDLDPSCLTGGITFHAAGYTRLNRICRERGLRVLADLHLHPGQDTRQSAIDAAHPMVARQGHLALIAPNFGSQVSRSHQLGAYTKSSTGWVPYTGHEIDSVFHVRLTLRGSLRRVRDRLVPPSRRTKGTR